MRQGHKARAVIKYLIETPEVDINALEDSTGVSIAHLCEDGGFMRYLATQRDFNPNVVNPHTKQTPLEYGVTYPKHPDITKALITCQRLVIDEAKIQALSTKFTHPRSIESLIIIKQEICRRKLGGGVPALAPGYRAVVTTTTTVIEPVPTAQPKSNENTGCRVS